MLLVGNYYTLKLLKKIAQKCSININTICVSKERYPWCLLLPLSHSSEKEHELIEEGIPQYLDSGTQIRRPHSLVLSP